MGGQVLGGGVIVLVAVALWLVYLLPSWYGRYQYNAAERNAVRLNQALRVLAETSETPDEVRVGLTARAAMTQQRLAHRAQAEREEISRKAQSQRDASAKKELAQREELERRAAAERERAETERQRAALESARQDRVAAQALPQARRARSHKRARRVVGAVWLTALLLCGIGAWLFAVGATPVPLCAGGALALVAVGLVVRVVRVRHRETDRSRTSARPARVEQAIAEPEVVAAPTRAWSPRELPRPLTVSAGSRAAAMLDGAQAHEHLRQAALEESIRERAERRRPPSLDAVRASRSAPADDAEIEAHVRDLLARRAVGD